MTLSHQLIRPVTPQDRAALERLWMYFRHEMSAYAGTLPFADGTFRRERLDAALTDPTWSARLVRWRDAPVGLVLVRGLDRPPYVLNSFFLVHAARRQGVGRAVVREVMTERPGWWEVAFQDANADAAAFWRSVAGGLDASFTEEVRAVPGRPDLPGDRWIRLRTGV